MDLVGFGQGSLSSGEFVRVLALTLTAKGRHRGSNRLHPITPVGPIEAEDLRLYDLKHQGHTVSVHVNNEPGADAARLSREKHIAASGSFLDLETAQWAVNQSVAHWQSDIREWLQSGSQSNFVKDLYFDHQVGSCLSRTDFSRGVVDPTPATGVRLVLKRSREFASGFAVLTAYPIVRPTNSSVLAPSAPLKQLVREGSNRLPRHIGRVANDLSRLLAEEPSISAASSFTDFEVAQKAVDQALALRADEVNDWLLTTNGSHAFTVTLPFVAGVALSRRAYERGENRPIPSNRVRVVLERSPSDAGGYRVRNAYPVLPWRSST